MPPALGDYDSLSDRDDERPSSSKRASSPPQIRKRGGLLTGLDAFNIIPSDTVVNSTAEDNTPMFATPSSHLTRRSARIVQTNDLAYDQRYHPIDEYLRPSQAAKRRAEHGLDDNSSVYSVESNISAENQPQPKKRKLNTFYIEGTRRSSRRINHDVLYNMQIHPQDSQLEQLAVEEKGESSEAAEEEGEQVVCDPTDEASNLPISSSPTSTPLSAISNYDEMQQSVCNDLHIDHRIHRSSVSPRVEQSPIAIYQKQLHTQPDDERNDEDKSIANGGGSSDLREQYLHSAIFDGPSYQTGLRHRHDCSARMPVQIGGIDSDSVLGSDIDSDVDG